jgi:formate dehydrogenase maturation protein FdhE
MSDLFGGLSGLMKGLSGFMPQDDPDVKIMNAQNEINDLRKKETEIYAEVGRQVMAREAHQFPELLNQLQLVQANLQEAERKLKSAQEEKKAKEAARQAEERALTCPSCGNYNPEGVKFCQECGTRLGVPKCSACGAELTPSARFCGECGKKQEV